MRAQPTPFREPGPPGSGGVRLPQPLVSLCRDVRGRSWGVEAAGFRIYLPGSQISTISTRRSGPAS